ncbi:hypothetical protein [Pontivivens ytuae]|uniref:Uncharacterized protein n=1 Tax=Pontivivens ytuae TaxID=2789856 RepID=A0A7S9QF89_9RHOB|nr:hypothetical protein [Pontivivens ytuae]QPH56001.1 hypothetical protein I0K15_09845 [Pontivivens ytuae]
MFDAEPLYVLLKRVFSKYPEAHVDQQSQLAEKLQLIRALSGEKPSFFAMTHQPARREMYDDLAKEISDQNCFYGAGELPVYFVGRELKIDDPRVKKAFTDRMCFPQPIFWLTCVESIAHSYKSGQLHSQSEELTLGYPRCCSDWHFDCYLARGVEAFCAVFQRSATPDDLVRYARSEWVPNSGFFLPDELYLTGLLAGEQRFPFLGHLACPDCRLREDSPSAVLNETYRRFAHEVDPAEAEQVAKWADELKTGLESRMNSIPRLIREASSETGLSGVDRETYERHSRYLSKALGLKK